MRDTTPAALPLDLEAPIGTFSFSAIENYAGWLGPRD